MLLTEQDRRLIRQVVHEGLNDFVQNAVSTASNMGKQGVRAIRNSYRSSNNGKPGFFSGTFNAAANALTNGSYGRLRQMHQQNQVQNAYKMAANGKKNRGAYIDQYEKKYFDYWAQNVKGSFHTDDNQRYRTNKEAADIAVNMWNSWYADQTGLDNTKNQYLDRYIASVIGNGKEAKDLSYDGFVKFKQKENKKKQTPEEIEAERQRQTAATNNSYYGDMPEKPIGVKEALQRLYKRLGKQLI